MLQKTSKPPTEQKAPRQEALDPKAKLNKLFKRKTEIRTQELIDCFRALVEQGLLSTISKTTDEDVQDKVRGFISTLLAPTEDSEREIGEDLMVERYLHKIEGIEPFIEFAGHLTVSNRVTLRESVGYYIQDLITSCTDIDELTRSLEFCIKLCKTLKFSAQYAIAGGSKLKHKLSNILIGRFGQEALKPHKEKLLAFNISLKPHVKTKSEKGSANNEKFAAMERLMGRISRNTGGGTRRSNHDNDY